MSSGTSMLSSSKQKGKARRGLKGKGAASTALDARTLKLSSAMPSSSIGEAVPVGVPPLLPRRLRLLEGGVAPEGAALSVDVRARLPPALGRFGLRSNITCSSSFDQPSLGTSQQPAMPPSSKGFPRPLKK
jgi:hypothetical protein